MDSWPASNPGHRYITLKPLIHSEVTFRGHSHRSYQISTMGKKTENFRKVVRVTGEVVEVVATITWNVATVTASILSLGIIGN